MAVIFIDGPDKIGKTTLVQKYADKFDKVFHWPSNNNTVWYLRPLLKQGTFNPDTQQVLHTLSHIVDIYENLDINNILVDRSIFSTYVYGKLFYVDEKLLNLLIRIHIDIIKKVWIPPYLFILVAPDKPFEDKESKADYYERILNWNNIKEEYLNVYSSPEIKSLFDEEIFEIITVPSIKDAEDILNYFLKG